MGHVFISYSKQDRGYARALVERLLAEGFDVWIDDRINSGDDWWRVILQAIRTCDAFIVLMSPDSDESRWVQREITIADELGKAAFPLLLAGGDNLLDSQNWSIYVRTQYSDVRGGSLPDADFFVRLERSAVRKDTPGVEVELPYDPSATPAHLNRAANREWTLSAGFNRGCYVRLAMVTSVVAVVFVAAYMLTMNQADRRPAVMNSESLPRTTQAAGGAALPPLPQMQIQSTALMDTSATALPSALASCPDSPPTRLEVGARGQVEPGGPPNRLRTAPSTDAEILEPALTPGTRFTVIGGPECNRAEGGPLIRFWQVNANGRTGWTAEGWLDDRNDADGYYLEPLAE
jgi:hypothetical protein